MQPIDIHPGATMILYVEDQETSPDTTAPVVIHHHGDTIALDIYLDDSDGEPDRTVNIPIADLLAGWTPR